MSADPVVEPAEKMLALALALDADGDNPDVDAHEEWWTTPAELAARLMRRSPELKECIELGRRIRDENDPLLAIVLHGECQQEWERKQARDPRMQFTQHGVDAHEPYAAFLRAALLRATEKPNA